MKFSKILCRYGEVTLKKDYTRKFFEDKLISNITKGLKSRGIEFKITREPGRLYIKTSNVEKSINILKKVFGLTTISPIKEFVIKADMEKLVRFGEKFARNFIKKEDTFAVRAKRTGNNAFTSQMIERRLGTEIVKKIGAKVNLTNPDKTIYVEVRQNKAYFFNERIKCPGGLPLGTQGKVVLLFSGGIDSAVAGWMLMKRGCTLIPLYIDTSPYTDSINLKRAKEVLKKLNEWSIGHKMKLITVKHGKFITEIVDKCKENLTCLLCKRMMYRVAEKIGEEWGAKAIVTGESLGQVASQTLDNINVLDQAINILVLRPLIGFDKEEIVDISRKIGTYESSILPSSGCSAVPRSPRTKGRLDEVLEEEKKLDIPEMLNKILKTKKTF
ncbi:MAG: tRNA 4-thiouridine(8) synthase ThiI [Candidatus Aenigmarchaeota archaeon]|nr:tRNA 4-thiouridine(8) synthase ThiI [Candidatus Aenigmarchaeota archaeon]